MIPHYVLSVNTLTASVVYVTSLPWHALPVSLPAVVRACRSACVSIYSVRAVGSEWACQAQFFIMLRGLACVCVGILPLYRCVT